ncbi:MAG: hypothetical protein WC956_02915 [bacterium]
MKRILAIIIVLLMGLASGYVRAQTVVGGYDLEKIAAATVERLTKADVVTPADKLDVSNVRASASSDPLVHGSEVIQFYARLGRILVERKAATPAEIDAVNKAAAKSGGVKIGGLNPAVLAASYLDLLVRKGMLTLQQAQAILDSAKR